MFNPPSLRVNDANIIDGSSIVNHDRYRYRYAALRTPKGSLLNIIINCDFPESCFEHREVDVEL